MKSNERLTEYSPNQTPIAKKSICSASPMVCHDYNCNECPIGEMINRLCEYEDTGLTPKEIVLLSRKIDAVGIDQRRHSSHLIITKVRRNGVLIKGQYYFSENLMLNHYGKTVEIYINSKSNKAYLYIQNKLIETFDLQ